MNVINVKEGADAQDASFKEQLALDVLMGFSSSPKSLSSKYFYDDVGSRLFQQITQTEAYYLTDAEYEILNTIKSKLPAVIDAGQIDIIELGAGDGHKSKLLIDGFISAGVNVHYYPIDISSKAMDLLNQNIADGDNLSVTGVIGEYQQGLRYIRGCSERPVLVLFLGSNIGNFNHASCLSFLRGIWNGLKAGDYLLTGFDLKKQIDVLTEAYNDPEGLTKAFNLNVLNRLNKELGANFDVSAFQHIGLYNPTLGAMESFLVSNKTQTVYVDALSHQFSFDAYEPIHLEYSFKYIASEIKTLANETGFEVIENYLDGREYFTDSLWRVVKREPMRPD